MCVLQVMDPVITMAAAMTVQSPFTSKTHIDVDASVSITPYIAYISKYISKALDTNNNTKQYMYIFKKQQIYWFYHIIQ